MEMKHLFALTVLIVGISISSAKLLDSRSLELMRRLLGKFITPLNSFDIVCMSVSHRHTDSGDLSPTQTCVPYVLLATV